MEGMVEDMAKALVGIIDCYGLRRGGGAPWSDELMVAEDQPLEICNAMKAIAAYAAAVKRLDDHRSQLRLEL